ncbi:hypothetical protein ABE354_08600 [Brevibacillus laterosporus]|uniref:hypothetical protein n=1 Tax=Brevibacillus laterosporus TaxID=1465 RepID=UPI003D260C5C
MRNQDDTFSETIFTTKQLSEMLDLSARRIQQLAEEGIFVREKRGRYKAIESMKNYISFIQEKDSDGESEVDYYEEKALHERAKREKAEIEVALLKGQMHKSQDVAAVMNDMVASCRAKLLSLPTKIAPSLLGKEDVAHVRELISKEIREALNELSEYSREVFLSQSAEYTYGDEDDC